MVNKPRAQPPLFGFLPPWIWQRNWRERGLLCVCLDVFVCVFIHVGSTWSRERAALVRSRFQRRARAWRGVNLKDRVSV